MLLIQGGTLKPIVGEEIQNGQLLIDDNGKIAAIGAHVDAPEGVSVVDAAAVHSAGHAGGAGPHEPQPRPALAGIVLHLHHAVHAADAANLLYLFSAACYTAL